MKNFPRRVTNGERIRKPLLCAAELQGKIDFRYQIADCRFENWIVNHKRDQGKKSENKSTLKEKNFEHELLILKPRI